MWEPLTPNKTLKLLELDDGCHAVGIILSEHRWNASSQASGHTVPGSDSCPRVTLHFFLEALKCLTDHILHFKQLSCIQRLPSLHRAHVPFEYTRSLLSLKVIYRLPASSAVQDTVKSASCARDVDACRRKCAASSTASASPLFRRAVALCSTVQTGGQHINIYFLIYYFMTLFQGAICNLQTATISLKHIGLCMHQHVS